MQKIGQRFGRVRDDGFQERARAAGHRQKSSNRTTTAPGYRQNELLSLGVDACNMRVDGEIIGHESLG